MKIWHILPSTHFLHLQEHWRETLYFGEFYPMNIEYTQALASQNLKEFFKRTSWDSKDRLEPRVQGQNKIIRWKLKCSKVQNNIRVAKWYLHHNRDKRKTWEREKASGIPSWSTETMLPMLTLPWHYWEARRRGREAERETVRSRK